MYLNGIYCRSCSLSVANMLSDYVSKLCRQNMSQMRIQMSVDLSTDPDRIPICQQTVNRLLTGYNSKKKLLPNEHNEFHKK